MASSPHLLFFATLVISVLRAATLTAIAAVALVAIQVLAIIMIHAMETPLISQRIFDDDEETEDWSSMDEKWEIEEDVIVEV